MLSLLFELIETKLYDLLYIMMALGRNCSEKHRTLYFILYPLYILFGNYLNH